MSEEGAQPAGRAPTGPEAGPGLADDPRALQVLTSEQAALSSARALVYNEAFTRAGMFLTFVSASLVALALVGQAMAFSRDFLVLAATLLAFDILIGVATLGRVFDAGLDDLRFIQGMNRIRQGYARVAPAVVPFLPGSIHDDAAGVFETYGSLSLRRGTSAIFHGLSTTGGMIATIVAVLAGALGAVAGLLLDRGQATVVGAGVVAFVVVFVALIRYGTSTIRAFHTSLTPRFPPDPPEG